MSDALGSPIKNQQSGLISAEGGRLRNQFLRQRELKVTCEHVVNNFEPIERPNRTQTEVVGPSLTSASGIRETCEKVLE